ncbi:hypothetical protein Lery_2700 [Legionella erythra]|uniref:Uncharacterized protein n=2 Tax=Legionella erythra TaxID=448 RepID=A0A0W0TH25_LEGER|nr:hypothetical protein [Legionella erythra]KTC94533.1 hypothetical protein Lery_2700 [Legionella erythra]
MQDKYSFFTPKATGLLPLAAEHTPLHTTIDLCSCAKEVMDYVQKLEKDQIIKMLHTPNKKGHLPIHLVDDLRLDSREKEKIYQLLLPYMKPALPSLSTPVDFKTISHQYEILSDSPLYQPLKIACLLVNQIRQTAFLSSTHPDMTGKDAEDVELLHREIKDYRNEADRAKYEYLYTCEDVTYHQDIREDDDYGHITAHFKPSVRDAVLQTYAEIPLSTKRANCTELSDIFVYLLNKMNLKDIRIEIFSIENGDHTLVVLNRDPKSDPGQFKTWGSRALVVDVWAGKIYPAASIPEQLSNYCSMDVTVDKKTNHHIFILPFIPAYHTLVLDTDVSLLEDTVSFRLTPDSFVGRFIKNLNLPEQELFLFHSYIKPLLKELIARRKLEAYELAELEYPVATLVYAFLDPYYLKKLTHRDVYLKDIEDKHIIDEAPHPLDSEVQWPQSSNETTETTFCVQSLTGQ